MRCSLDSIGNLRAISPLKLPCLNKYCDLYRPPKVKYCDEEDPDPEQLVRDCIEGPYDSVLGDPETPPLWRHGSAAIRSFVLHPKTLKP